ncbi:hypothetical protein SAMN05660703_2789 [Cellulophaga tyrosinoxydans]|uniref:Uncharacterized protein n=1 Tax=Cellulophaga tyrosinoxydans TaxID=504486 RepID=A0A1W2C3F1_9FLAO|nr:hypothetical protein SAMN05660703_2789 [Cellulophaga tyrosinoxydans]
MIIIVLYFKKIHDFVANEVSRMKPMPKFIQEMLFFNKIKKPQCH